LIHVDPFDPRDWPRDEPEDVCYLHLSSRIDCYAILDRIDYEWAKGLASAGPFLLRAAV